MSPFERKEDDGARICPRAGLAVVAGPQLGHDEKPHPPAGLDEEWVKTCALTAAQGPVAAEPHGDRLEEIEDTEREPAEDEAGDDRGDEVDRVVDGVDEDVGESSGEPCEGAK